MVKVGSKCLFLQMTQQRLLATDRPHSEVPPAVSTPVELLERRTQPLKWPQHLLDADTDTLRRALLREPDTADPFDIDEEERQEGSSLLPQYKMLKS